MFTDLIGTIFRPLSSYEKFDLDISLRSNCVLFLVAILRFEVDSFDPNKKTFFGFLALIE